MEWALIGLLVGSIIGFGVATVIYEKAEATEFGAELKAMRRASETEVADVRLIYRGVPSEDDGPDLL